MLGRVSRSWVCTGLFLRTEKNRLAPSLPLSDLTAHQTCPEDNRVRQLLGINICSSSHLHFSPLPFPTPLLKSRQGLAGGVRAIAPGRSVSIQAGGENAWEITADFSWPVSLLQQRGTKRSGEMLSFLSHAATPGFLLARSCFGKRSGRACGAPHPRIRSSNPRGYTWLL